VGLESKGRQGEKQNAKRETCRAVGESRKSLGGSELRGKKKMIATGEGRARQIFLLNVEGETRGENGGGVSPLSCKKKREKDNIFCFDKFSRYQKT